MQIIKKMVLPESIYNNSDENLNTNENNIIVPTDSDSDDEEDHTGYELIARDVDECEIHNHHDDTDDEEDGESLDPPQEDAQNASGLSAEDSIVQEVWKEEPDNRRNDIVMDNEKVSEIIQVMNNFQLPPGNIPEWAQNVPEEVWKQRLQERLQNS